MRLRASSASIRNRTSADTVGKSGAEPSRTICLTFSECRCDFYTVSQHACQQCDCTRGRRDRRIRHIERHDPWSSRAMRSFTITKLSARKNKVLIVTGMIFSSLTYKREPRNIRDT